MSDLNHTADFLPENGTAPKWALHSRFIGRVAYCYILPIICAIGIVGNVANLMTLASPRLKQVSYMYLRALAVADLACMLFVMIFCTLQMLQNIFDVDLSHVYMLVWYQAHLMLTMINYSVSAGILVVVALTVERYVSVCFPIVFRSWNNPRRALINIVAAYSIPLMFYVPYGYFRYQVDAVNATDATVTYVSTDSDWYKGKYGSGYRIYEICREIMLKGAPILTLAVLNLQIMFAFRRRTKLRTKLKRPTSGASMPPSQAQSSTSRANTKYSVTSGAPQTQQMQLTQMGGTSLHHKDSSCLVQSAGGGSQKDRAARDDALLFLLAGIVLMFFICNTPAAINLLLINEENKRKLYYLVFRAIANLLEITNHAMNFYVFCLCSGDYRTAFWNRFPLLTSVHNKLEVCGSYCSQMICAPRRRYMKGNRQSGTLPSAELHNTHSTSAMAAPTENGAGAKTNDMFAGLSTSHIAVMEDFDIELEDDISSEMTCLKSSGANLTAYGAGAKNPPSVTQSVGNMVTFDDSDVAVRPSDESHKPLVTLYGNSASNVLAPKRSKKESGARDVLASEFRGTLIRTEDGQVRLITVDSDDDTIL